MTKRPNWFARKRRKIRRFLFRRLVLPAFNRELERSNRRIFTYDESHDRLGFSSRISWEWLEAKVETMRTESQWYGPLQDRNIRTDVIFDVGGCGGATATWFSRWADRVFVFEPSPDNREALRLHQKIRAVTNAEVIATAVGDEIGETTLCLKPKAGHHSLGDIGASETVSRIQVGITTLDAFAAERAIEHVGVLKIDVEGYEPEVIRGADRLLRECRIDLVVFEYSPAFYRQRGIDPLLPVDELEKRGYSVTALDGSAVDRETLGRGRQTDLLAEPRR